MVMESKKSKFKTLNLVYIALFSVLITICSWIYVPTVVPFTLQTFAIFCALCLLGGKLGTCSIIVYILLGVVGIPVFAGFNGGVGALLGATGGYIIGFIFMGLIYWLITGIFGNKTYISFIAMILGLAVCYAIGTAWFMFVYIQKSGSISLLSVLGLCVFPFIIPDMIKMILAVFLAKKLACCVKV
ncbi:biotin transporter BioY [Anaerosacchariphilus polymeriproducens]|uniref:Biotin transporter n=2 Tax=Anaerosacchariphilus polymeriproducens TaxID=1812858 RepID=A0A371AT87_9FIRM|nr:biotin transporter BioY [Anaerosacchariphilus polymeriproducens]